MNPATPKFPGKTLFADIYRAQQTSSIKQLLPKNKTVLTKILGGATSRLL